MLDILHDYGLILLIGEYPHGPLGGLAMTLILAAAALLLSFPLAVLVGIGRTSPIRLVSRLAGLYANTVRGLPLLLLVFWSYFAVPMLFGKSINASLVMLVALVIYESAYLGEIVKAGIQALPRGQTEAARTLGMGYWTTLRKVILPQALFNMIPSILNQLISLIKNTSLAYIISVNELTYAAYQVNAQLLTKPFQVYFLLAMTYFAICYALSSLVGLVERRIKHKRQFRSV